MGSGLGAGGGPLHLQGIDRAGPHPFLDGAAPVEIPTGALRDQGQADPILQVTAEQLLAAEVGQCLAREVCEAEFRIEGPRVIGAQRRLRSLLRVGRVFLTHCYRSCLRIPVPRQP